MCLAFSNPFRGFQHVTRIYFVSDDDSISYNTRTKTTRAVHQRAVLRTATVFCETTKKKNRIFQLEKKNTPLINNKKRRKILNVKYYVRRYIIVIWTLFARGRTAYMHQLWARADALTPVERHVRVKPTTIYAFGARRRKSETIKKKL